MNRIDAILVTMMLLESAHLASPVLLAWWRPELRRVVSREWVRHLLLPVAVLPACVVAPASWVFGLYYAWNIHHFGMQNFGVWQLFGRKCSPDFRVLRGLICLSVTAFGMAAGPILWPGIYGLVIGTLVFSINHWLVDIGLSSRVAPRAWWFIAAVVAIGIVYTIARQGPLSVHVLPQILVLRCGLGFVHFIYSARIWRSDVGIDLLKRRHPLVIPPFPAIAD